MGLWHPSGARMGWGGGGWRVNGGAVRRARSAVISAVEERRELFTSPHILSHFAEEDFLVPWRGLAARLSVPRAGWLNTSSTV